MARMYVREIYGKTGGKRAIEGSELLFHKTHPPRNSLGSLEINLHLF
jgi:hypothetical protein